MVFIVSEEYFLSKALEFLENVFQKQPSRGVRKGDLKCAANLQENTHTEVRFQ